MLNRMNVGQSLESGDAIPPRGPRPPLPWERAAAVSADVRTMRSAVSPGLLLSAVRSLQERRLRGARFADILEALVPSCPGVPLGALRLQLTRQLRRAVNQHVLNRSVGGTYTLVRPAHISGNW